MTFVTVFVLAIAALVAVGVVFASYNRETVPTPVQAQQAETKTPIESNHYLYPDRNGRYVQVARLVKTRGNEKVLHVGHPNNAPFTRPLAELRVV